MSPSIPGLAVLVVRFLVCIDKRQVAVTGGVGTAQRWHEEGAGRGRTYWKMNIKWQTCLGGKLAISGVTSD